MASALQRTAGKGCIMKRAVMNSVTSTIRPRHRAAVLFCGLAAVAATAGSAIAAGCGFEPQGEGRVGTIIDNRTFRLEDGREVRLAGIQTVTTGSTALAALIAGRDVTLRGETDAPDRWGRQAAFVFAEPTVDPIRHFGPGSDTAVRASDTSIRACCWRGARRAGFSRHRRQELRRGACRRRGGSAAGRSAEPGPIRAS